MTDEFVRTKRLSDVEMRTPSPSGSASDLTCAVHSRTGVSRRGDHRSPDRDRLRVRPVSRRRRLDRLRPPAGGLPRESGSRTVPPQPSFTSVWWTPSTCFVTNSVHPRNSVTAHAAACLPDHPDSGFHIN